MHLLATYHVPYYFANIFSWLLKTKKVQNGYFVPILLRRIITVGGNCLEKLSSLPKFITFTYFSFKICTYLAIPQTGHLGLQRRMTVAVLKDFQAYWRRQHIKRQL